MSKDLEQLQEKTWSSTKQYLQKIDCLQQKIANNIENKLPTEQIVSPKLVLEGKKLKSELHFLNIQILAFTKNIERIANFKNQKNNFTLEQAKLTAKQKELQFKIDNYVTIEQEEFIQNLEFSINSNKEYIEKVRKRETNKIDEFIKIIKSKIISNQDFEEIFENKKYEKGNEKDDIDFLKAVIAKYKFPIDDIRKLKEKAKLRKSKFYETAEKNAKIFNETFNKIEETKILNKYYDDLDEILFEYFEPIKTKINEETEIKLKNFYQDLNQKLGIKGYIQVVKFLDRNCPPTSAEDEKSIEKYLKANFSNLLVSGKELYNEKILSIFKKNKDQTLQKKILHLKDEVATNLPKVNNCLTTLKECFEADNAPIYQKFLDWETHVEKTIETTDNNVKSRISFLDYLGSKEYTDEKVKYKNLMLAVEDKNLTIDDFLTLKNSEEINDFHLVLQTPIVKLTEQAFIKECQAKEQEIKISNETQLKELTSKINANEKKWNSFQNHELAIITNHAQSLTRGELEDIELAGRLINLSEKNEKFSSWNEFIIPNAGEMVSDEKVEEMLKKLVYFNDEPFDNSSFSSFPKNNSAWEKLFEETKIKIIEFNIWKDEEELKKINEKEKELEVQLATLRKSKAENQKQIESQKQKVVADKIATEKNTKTTNLSLKDKKMSPQFSI